MKKKLVFSALTVAMILLFAFKALQIVKFDKFMSKSIPKKVKKFGKKPLPSSSMRRSVANVTITIKSTKKFHKTRVELLLKTWIKQVLNQVRKS